MLSVAISSCKQTKEKSNLDKELYWKEIFYIVHVITLEDTQQQI